MQTIFKGALIINKCHQNKVEVCPRGSTSIAIIQENMYLATWAPEKVHVA